MKRFKFLLITLIGLVGLFGWPKNIFAGPYNTVDDLVTINASCGLGASGPLQKGIQVTARFEGPLNPDSHYQLNVPALTTDENGVVHWKDILLPGSVASPDGICSAFWYRVVTGLSIPAGSVRWESGPCTLTLEATYKDWSSKQTFQISVPPSYVGDKPLPKPIKIDTMMRLTQNTQK